MELKYTPQTLQKIESILKSNGYLIRYEKGHFNSGYCVIKDKKVVVVNKFYNVEARINCLIDILHEIEIDTEQFGDEKLEKYYQALMLKPN